jgi:gas vesicle protein
MAADAQKGLTMDDRARIALGMAVGAAVGGFVGFVLFTERGRAFRQELEPQLEDLFGEAQRLTAAFDKTRKAVKDGLATLHTEASEAKPANPDWSH